MLIDTGNISIYCLSALDVRTVARSLGNNPTGLFLCCVSNYLYWSSVYRMKRRGSNEGRKVSAKKIMCSTLSTVLVWALPA